MDSLSPLITPLTFTHLRFQARAVQPIRLGEYQGAERLRRSCYARYVPKHIAKDKNVSYTWRKFTNGGQYV